MITILRIYTKDPATKKEVCIKDPAKIITLLSNEVVEDYDLDYSTGQSVKMGSLSELSNKKVRIGSSDVIIPSITSTP